MSQTEGTTKTGMGLYPKIISFMLLISLCPLCLFFIFIYTETSSKIQKDTEILMTETTTSLTKQIDLWVDNNVSVLKTAAGLSAIKSMEQNSQEEILKTIRKEYPWMYLIFIVDEKGKNVSRSDGKPLKDYSNRQYFKDIINGKDLSWQTLIGKTSGKPALVISVPIKINGKIKGVIAAAMTTDVISKYIATWSKGSTGYAFLLDEKNKIIAHPKQEYVLNEKIFNDHPILSSGEKTYTKTFMDENGQKTIGFLNKNNLGWSIIVQQGKSEIYSPLTRFQIFISLFFVCSTIIVILVAWMLGKQIVKPIMVMTDAANEISMGNFDIKLDIHTRDEIGLLANSISRMQTSLAFAMKKIKKLK